MHHYNLQFMQTLPNHTTNISPPPARAAIRLNKQTVLPFPEQPYASHFDATFVHSFKFAPDMWRFHNQILHELRPLQPRLNTFSAATAHVEGSSRKRMSEYKYHQYDNAKSCVHNPAEQMRLYLDDHPECPPSRRWHAAARQMARATLAEQRRVLATQYVAIVLPSNGDQIANTTRARLGATASRLRGYGLAVTVLDQAAGRVTQVRKLGDVCDLPQGAQSTRALRLASTMHR